MTRRGLPTGRRPGFTREDVVAAALDIGVNDFTLTAVAKRLGVAVSGLYRTIDSREDLLRACLVELAGRMRFRPDPACWRRNARNQVDALWALLESAPGLDRTLLTVPWASECFADTITASHRAFVNAGLDDEDAALVVGTIGDTVIGSHIAVAALRATWDGEAPARTGPAGLPLPFQPDGTWLERGWVDRKIDLLLDGLEARRTPRP